MRCNKCHSDRMVAVYRHKFQCQDCKVWYDDCGYGTEQSNDAMRNRGEI